MKGKLSGVQKKFLDQNPLAFLSCPDAWSDSCAMWCGETVWQICPFLWCLRETVLFICYLSYPLEEP
jgi:hypothetical protein